MAYCIGKVIDPIGNTNEQKHSHKKVLDIKV